MTKLIYLENMQLLESSARIEDIKELENGTISIVLDQTVFYPQGGGQPYDNGLILKNQDTTFNVTEVRFNEGLVHHIGVYISGKFNIGDEIKCIVEKSRRDLHTRFHSAGHLVDMGLFELGKKWKPTKGYHFPQGAYVEYELSDNVFDESLIKELEMKCNEIIKRNIDTKIMFMDKSEMSKYCHFVPDFLPERKPSRIVLYGEFGVPCGGTHCKNLSEIQNITIRKIKKEKDMIRVSYDVNN
ncbi:MAG: hypothetical protein QG614_428 [Patescibacteria group bacterium]|nr:hypothetical protein [Patescibacteria group bacterium]